MRRSFILAALGATFLGGCTVAPPGDSPVAVARGPVPTTSATPMDQALGCLSLNLAPDFDMRLAVHSLPDRTGVNDYDGPGAYVTQGAELMMVSALAKSGVRQVNRTATSIAEWELGQAMEKRLGPGRRSRDGRHPAEVRHAAARGAGRPELHRRGPGHHRVEPVRHQHPEPAAVA